MRYIKPRLTRGFGIGVLLLGLASMGCSEAQPEITVCAAPQGNKLDAALEEARWELSHGCETSFDGYLTALLDIAEGDPRPENKRLFSEFLVWTSHEGVLSKRQAQRAYNRYFNVKFVSLQGDYNNCAYTCPIKDEVMLSMEQELVDKERGLLKVSADQSGYYRADRLFQETQLVLEATCSACPSKP